MRAQISDEIPAVHSIAVIAKHFISECLVDDFVSTSMAFDLGLIFLIRNNYFVLQCRLDDHVLCHFFEHSGQADQEMECALKVFVLKCDVSIVTRLYNHIEALGLFKVGTWTLE